MNILINDIYNVERTKNLNTDFRVAIMFELLMQDDTLSEEIKVYKALELFYDEIPEDIEEALKNILWFYLGGQDLEELELKGNRSGSNNEMLYDFEYDSELIYSAFLDQYGIDLQEVYMHWWKFKALFKGLKEDNQICKIMGYRGTKLSDIKDKDMKSYYSKLKNLYRIPKTKQKAADTSVFW